MNSSAVLIGGKQIMDMMHPKIIGLEPVSLMIKKSKLRWFGHVKTDCVCVCVCVMRTKIKHGIILRVLMRVVNVR